MATIRGGMVACRPNRQCNIMPACDWLRRALLALALVLAGVAMVWGPRYARGLSLVVRAAHLDGWLKTRRRRRGARWTAGPATTIPTRHGAIPARIYRPDGRIRRAAVLTPGVHAMGIEEPRLRGLAGDLAASGLAVVTIALPDLVRYRFTAESVDQIEDAAAWLAAQPDLAPDGKVGLMGISFAGGLSVVAAGRPRCATRSPTCSRSAATAICSASCATCAPGSSRCRPVLRRARRRTSARRTTTASP